MQLLACPDPGQAFLYICGAKFEDLFKADGYWWRHGGTHKSDCRVTTSYYYITQPSEDPTATRASHSCKFKKTVFIRTDDNFKEGLPVIIWYSGDKSVVERMSHGNSKVDKQYVPTIPSTIKKIKEVTNLNISNKKTMIALKNELTFVDRK